MFNFRRFHTVLIYRYSDKCNSLLGICLRRQSTGVNPTYPLQYSCLENPMDGGACGAAVHGVAEGRTRLSDFTFTFHFHFSLSCIGEGNGNPLQCSCLENPRDRVAWWAAVYGVTQSWTWLKWLSSSSNPPSTNHELSAYRAGIEIIGSPCLTASLIRGLGSDHSCLFWNI